MNELPDYICAYREHKHLKKAADELGMKWQTLYLKLIAYGEPVIGDKSRYGSESDKFAARGERIFQSIVPSAKDMNKVEFQSKFDFEVYGLKVDVKSSRKKNTSSKSKSLRWAFSIKKQRLIADFIVCICFDNDRPQKYLLLPREVVKNHGTISLPCNGGKWSDFETDPCALESFFKDFSEAT